MTDFNQTWGVTWEVEKTIPGARACLTENTGRSYRSGRPIIEAVFYDGSRREICRRQGMTLTSKKGQDYTVCRKEADKPAAARATADDVFEDGGL
jgi:hypothetical protein